METFIIHEVDEKLYTKYLHVYRTTSVTYLNSMFLIAFKTRKVYKSLLYIAISKILSKTHL